MKRKKIMGAGPRGTKKEGKVFTAQMVDDILVLNFYKDKKLKARYCINTENSEYEAYLVKEGVWVQRRIADVWDRDYYNSPYNVDAEPSTEADLRLVRRALHIKHTGSVFPVIESREYARNAEIRRNSEDNKRRRIEELMAKFGGLPEDFNGWLCRVAGVGDYAFMDRDSGELVCSACGGRFTRKKEDGKKAVHNEYVECPHCKKSLQAKTRVKRVCIKCRAVLLQAVDEIQGAARHFQAEITVDDTGAHVSADEEIRIMLYRQKKEARSIREGRKSRYLYKIYYSSDKWHGGWWQPEWSESNPTNRRHGSSFLYPEGIKEALRDTAYEPWAAVFALLAKAGRRLWYNNLMAAYFEPGLPGIVEYLYKGRFYKLVAEVAEHTWVFTGRYSGPLDTGGSTAEDIFRIGDRQKINRIRDKNGGHKMVEWMQMSERHKVKLADEVIGWLDSSDISPKDIDFIMDRMSPQQVMNYVKKQQASEYPGLTEKQILSQWADYLYMCVAAGKDTMDEMVYRPRQLKRRHDELVEERNRQQILEDMQQDEEGRRRAAQALKEKFPGAEEVLREVAPKLAYENGQFKVIVPESLFDIVTEGQALHHCVGISDRYFDRIMQRETYICFLRRAEEPAVPFYTIEVEPGGTVRQHRSRFDEEPNIEEIRGFLREWQQEVRRRMDGKDRKYADASRKKREENMEELKRQNNLRVLKGLQEDFMEAI